MLCGRSWCSVEVRRSTESMRSSSSGIAMTSARRISGFSSTTRASCCFSVRRASLLLYLCLGIGLGFGKECTNVPTERVSHSIRSREIERGGVFDEVPVADSRLREGESSQGMLATSLIRSFRKFSALDGWNGRGQRDEVRGFDRESAAEELTDDVVVDFDDWEQAWRTIGKPMADKTAKSGERRRMRVSNRVQRDALALQLQMDEEIGGNYVRRRSLEPSEKEVVSRSEPAVAGLLKDVSLHKVRLGAGSPQYEAQNTNLEYLLELDVDSMVWSFRKVANLDAPGLPYGGWESPASELRGHFVGHYLSASALMWASTHNESLLEKMNALVRALKECQMSIGSGYLSAFPSEFFDRFEAIEPVWAPYYTIHKIMAGLLDQYVLAGSKDALGMVVKMANYFDKRVQSVIERFTIERHWRSLNEETGGMNDVLYRLYTVTSDEKHLDLAHLFDKPCFLGPLALQADHLSGFHSNTHIPVVVGAQTRYEVTGDPIYRSIADYFMEIVNSSHSYATGGTSVSEFWTDPMRQGDTLHTENQESCTTYNMLKIARSLFRWTKDIKYMDYYERTLLNGILGIQRGQQPGVMIYMLPMAPGASKARSYHGWGSKFNSFWCCYGTGIESFAKLGDSIYFEEDGKTPAVYITQHTNSDFEWDAAGLLIHQTHKPLYAQQSVLEASFSFSRGTTASASAAASGENATIHIRIPAWTPPKGCRAYLNDEEIEAPIPGNFLSVSREWSPGDQLVLLLPMGLRLEKIQGKENLALPCPTYVQYHINTLRLFTSQRKAEMVLSAGNDDRHKYSAMHAIMYGPFVMAGLSMGDWKLEHVGDNLSKWVYPVPVAYNSQLSTFSQDVIGDQHSGRLFMTCDNGTAVMSSAPVDGTDQSGLATFRVTDSLSGYSLEIAYGKRLVSLELFSHPGSFLKHNGKDNLISAGPPNCLEHTSLHNKSWTRELVMNFQGKSKILGEDCPSEDSVFLFLPGLTGESDTVSFEAASQPGCFLSSSSGETSVPGGVLLRCKSSGNENTFDAQSTFSVQRGVAAYHPASFIAQGKHRSFLLAPLNSLRDESYTIYFDIQ